MEVSKCPMEEIGGCVFIVKAKVTEGKCGKRLETWKDWKGLLKLGLVSEGGFGDSPEERFGGETLSRMEGLKVG